MTGACRPSGAYLPPALRALSLVVLLGAIGGCAAFNDTVVVDVGDQFRLIEADVPLASQRLQHANGAGFECTFNARSERSSLFGREKTVDGSIRCKPLTPDTP